MKLQTQYGIDADWRDVHASNVPVISAQWLKSVASAVGKTVTEVTDSLERGEIIELAGCGIEWHDRIRKAVE